jgi:tetratricopeptide (TPR) repeat protein
MQQIDAPESLRTNAANLLQVAERLDALRETTPRQEWRAQVQAEWENWRKALEWALGARNDVLLGQRLVGALETAWWVLSEADARRWIRAAREAVDDTTPDAIVGRLELARARFYLERNRFKRTHAAAERALAECRRAGDEIGIARAEFLAGHSLVVMGHTAEGEKLLQSALAGFRKLEARRSTGVALASLALAREDVGDIAEARSLCMQAVEVVKSIEGERGNVDLANYLAELEFRAGNADAALAIASEGVARYRRLNDRLYTLVNLSNAAAYLIALDRYDEARTHAREALELAVQEKNALWAAFALQHVAAVAALEGNGARAARLVGFVEARMAELKHRREHTERQEHDRIMTLLRKELAGDELERLMAEGRARSEERAVAEALALS